jgi:hypothetical protein
LFILPEALMSDTNASFPIHEPSNPNVRVEKDGYKAAFYGGFVSRLAVRTAETETELYNQDRIFYLPPGREKPWPCSTLAFVGPDGRRFELQIDDPDQQIGKIEIHLKDSGNTGPRRELVQRLLGTVKGYEDADPPPAEEEGGRLVVILEDAPVLCPPACPF